MASSDPSPAPSHFDLPPGENDPESLSAAPGETPGLSVTGDTKEYTPAVATPGPGKESDKAAQLGLGTRERLGSSSPGSRVSNLRRTPLLSKVMVLTLLAYLAVLVLVAIWFHHRLMSGIDARLEAARGTPSPSPGMAASRSNTQDQTAELKRIESLLGTESKEAEAALALLTTRLAAAEAQNQKQNSRIEELASALSEIRSTLKDKKNAPPVPSAALPAGDGLAPTQGELILLKERNRLTSYADEAIATGARAPYEKIWEALDDPRLANLAHAARAEILRVQNFYLGGSRIDRYDIPVATYFPEQSALKDSQLKDEQLMKLLREKNNPWEVRMKAANLLGMRRSLEAGDALAAAVKDDENLDVVKEATFSFEQMTGFRARLFDAASLTQWWKEYEATPTPPNPKPKAKAKSSDKSPGTEGKKNGPGELPRNQAKEKEMDAEKKNP
jgi:hypothetical protein